MELSTAIAQLYPEAISLVDYVLQDDGRGVYIAIWNLNVPRPTVAELAALGAVEARKTMSVLSEWANLNRKLLDQAQDIIDATARPRRLGQANDIPAQIAATAANTEVGDSGLTKERAAAINAMWESFEAWLATPLESVELAPIQILSMRDA